MLTIDPDMDTTDLPVTDETSGTPSRVVETTLQTVSIFVPLLHNPMIWGIRLPVGPLKISRTLREAKQRFSGFSLSLTLGWCKCDAVWDPLLRLDVDTAMTPAEREFLSSWKEILTRRFGQREIYTKIAAWIHCI